MPVLYPFSGWTVPVGQITVDRSNPITKDMIGFFIPGKDFTDYVYADTATLTGGGSVVSFPSGPYGPELATTGGGGQHGQLFQKPGRLTLQPSFATIFSIAKVLSSPPGGNTGSALYGERAGSGNDIFKLDYSTNTGSFEFTLRNDAGTLLQVAMSAADGLYHSFCGTKNGNGGGGNVIVYRDAIQRNTGSWIGTDSFTNANRSTIGYDFGDGSASFPGSIVMVATFTRALSAEEVRSLHLNPFQLVMPAEGEMPALNAPSGITVPWNTNYLNTISRKVEIIAA